MHRAEALVLEDNPRELEEVGTLVAACGLSTFEARAASEAIRWLTAVAQLPRSRTGSPPAPVLPRRAGTRSCSA